MSFYCLIVCLTETLVSGSTRSLMTGGHIRPQTPRRSTSLTSGNSPMSTKTRYESFYMKMVASLLCFLYIKSKILFTLNYIHYLISFGGLVQRLYFNQHFQGLPLEREDILPFGFQCLESILPLVEDPPLPYLPRNTACTVQVINSALSGGSTTTLPTLPLPYR